MSAGPRRETTKWPAGWSGIVAALNPWALERMEVMHMKIDGSIYDAEAVREMEAQAACDAALAPFTKGSEG